MKLLALDLSSRSTGYAIKDGDKLIDYGCITQPSNKHYIDRIFVITSKVLELIKQYDIKKVYCEEVRFGDTNTHTFKTLVYLQAQIVCGAHLQDPAIEFIFFQPSEHRAKVGIKTGRGITREQCKAAAIKYAMDKYNIDVNDDVADAITIADAAGLGGVMQSTTSARLPQIGSGPSAF